MSLPLYDDELKPRWDQHPEGSSVDLALYPLDPVLEDHFHVLDVSDAIRGKKLEETVAKDVFIIGYPFGYLMSRLRRLFGRSAVNRSEMSILRGILTETQKAARGDAHKRKDQ